MSGTNPRNTPPNPESPHNEAASNTEPPQAESDPMSSLDARLLDLNLPQSPYLRIITGQPFYRLGGQQAIDFRKGTLFDRGEEALQYATFLPHTSLESQLLQAERIADWDDGNGGIILQSRSFQRGAGIHPLVANSTPVGPKRLTMEEYKQRQERDAEEKEGVARSEEDENPPPQSQAAVPIIKKDMYRVLYDFEGRGQYELTVKKGEILELLKKDRNGWSRAKKSDGTSQGWVPASYLKEEP